MQTSHWLWKNSLHVLEMFTLFERSKYGSYACWLVQNIDANCCSDANDLMVQEWMVHPDDSEKVESRWCIIELVWRIRKIYSTLGSGSPTLEVVILLISLDRDWYTFFSDSRLTICGNCFYKRFIPSDRTFRYIRFLIFFGQWWQI